jgi:spore cortex formation protein SpoVR/YcgB (stage V sporulation)
MYDHWSFGKSLITNENAYKKGQMGLAYEVVINTNPCIAYLMEENTMTMQALVMAHAVCGHGSFFKNNYLFTEWTDADYILEYLKFAKNYIKDCEEKYGTDQVETLLDACHSLRHYGIDKYKRKRILGEEEKDRRALAHLDYIEKNFNELWNTVVGTSIKEETLPEKDRMFPEENILYFIEKYSPILETWEKEIVRIVRQISQYFYPQMQTQLMNEGWATFCHYEIMTEMYERGYLTEGSYLEFIQNHTNVITQRGMNSDYYNGINVYALGFAMMSDIKRICLDPTPEDNKWFPDIAGTKDYWKVLKDIIVNYRDESFILQFLSPKVIRDFQLCVLHDDPDKDTYSMDFVHDDDDVLEIRKHLSRRYSLTYNMPQIEISNVDWSGKRDLELRYLNHLDKDLNFDKLQKTIDYIDELWGLNVSLESEE